MFNPNDDVLKQQVENAIAGYPALTSSDITIRADEGDVVLEGVVDTEEARSRAYEAVRSVPGVKSVNNKLRLRGEGSQSMGEYLDDAGITLSVKTKLMGERGLSSMKIHVETMDGVVDLTGDVQSHDQARLAESVAQRADGVKRVQNKLVVKP